MIPLEKKKVKYFARKSNTIREKRRKNKALVKYVLQKTPKACLRAPFLRPLWGCNEYKTRLLYIHGFEILPDFILSQRFRKTKSNIKKSCVSGGTVRPRREAMYMMNIPSAGSARYLRTMRSNMPYPGQRYSFRSKRRRRVSL